MKVGLTIERFEGIEPAKLVQLARRFGVEMVELSQSSFENVDDVVLQMGSLAAGLHLPLIGQDGFDFSCPSHQAEIDALIETINAHWQRLHLQYALSHPPEPAEASEPLETSEDLLLRNLARLNLPILLENVPTWDQTSFERFYDAARQQLGSQLLGICFDAPHVFLRGEDPVAQFEAWATQVKAVHLSDCSPTEDLHLPFDSGGVLPINDFLDALRRHRFDGFLILELQPRSIKELRPVVQSYLHVLRRFKPAKYLTSKVKLLAAASRLRVTD